MDDIEKETFMNMDISSQMGVLFDYHKATYIKIAKLEKRKWLNTTAAGIGGIFGGILAALFGYNALK